LFFCVLAISSSISLMRSRTPIVKIMPVPTFSPRYSDGVNHQRCQTQATLNRALMVSTGKR
jgi:hypothetical protein